MQTMKDVAPAAAILAEYRRLDAGQLAQLIDGIAAYYDHKLIDREVHDHLLFHVLLSLEQREKVAA